MSNKVQELNEITSANDSDLVYVVRNTGGVYSDHKIAKSNLVDTVVPVDTGDLTNNAGFITASDLPTIPADVSDLTDTTGLIPADVSDLTDTTGLIPADISANVLQLDNTTEFTPDADYEPATKKYVDENAGGEVVERISLHYDFRNIEDDVKYDLTLVNSTIVEDYYGAKVTLGGAIGDRAYFKLYENIYQFWDKNPSMRFTLYDFRQYQSAVQFILGNNNIGTAGKRAEFDIISSQASVYSSDGATDTRTDYTLNMQTGNQHEFYIKVNSGTDIKFYVDNVLIATHTNMTNLADSPMQNNCLFAMESAMTGNAASVPFYLGNLTISFDALE